MDCFMKTLHLFASISGFVGFGLGLWQKEFNGYALAVGFYALSVALLLSNNKE